MLLSFNRNETLCHQETKIYPVKPSHGRNKQIKIKNNQTKLISYDTYNWQLK